MWLDSSGRGDTHPFSNDATSHSNEVISRAASPGWSCVTCRVLENRKMAEGVFLLKLACREIAGCARPGQFVHVRCCEAQGLDPFLRRPLSLSSIDRDKGIVEVLFKVVGRGTRYLSARKAGEELDVIGPLGNGFPDPGGSAEVILVAGGMGVGPLVSVASFRHEMYPGSRTMAFVGARTRSELVIPDPLKDWTELQLATDDGSLGFAGPVTALLRQFIKSSHGLEVADRSERPAARPASARATTSSRVFFACGPPGMLEEFGSLIERYGLEGYCSLEQQMACGVGACFGCSVNPGLVSSGGERSDAGDRVYPRVCTDGPVFRVGRRLEAPGGVPSLSVDTSPRSTRQPQDDSPPSTGRPQDGFSRSAGGPRVPSSDFAAREAAASPRMDTVLAGIRMRTPVVAVSGTVAFGSEYREYLLSGPVGAVVTKTITLEPRAGNPPPRIIETPAGLLNSIGLENPGVDRFIREELPRMMELNVPIIVSIAGETVERFAALADRLVPDMGIVGVELNVSCPNVERGGVSFGVDADSVRRVVSEVKSVTPLPVIVKLTPNVTSIAEIARAAERAGADAVSLVNTFRGMAIDPETRRPLLGNVFGGVSGPAIRPVAVRMVWEAADAVSIPIIGMGGITCARDALEFILAGASVVGVGSGMFLNPRVIQQIVQGMEEYLVRHGIPSVSDLVGAAKRPPVTGQSL